MRCEAEKALQPCRALTMPKRCARGRSCLLTFTVLSRCWPTLNWRRMRNRSEKTNTVTLTTHVCACGDVAMPSMAASWVCAIASRELCHDVKPLANVHHHQCATTWQPYPTTGSECNTASPRVEVLASSHTCHGSHEATHVSSSPPLRCRIAIYTPSTHEVCVDERQA